MTSSTRTADTATPPQTTDKCSPSGSYEPRNEPETQGPATERIPSPYARIVTGLSTAYQERVSVIYDHGRAQREMAFLHLNEILESRRR